METCFEGFESLSEGGRDASSHREGAAPAGRWQELQLRLEEWGDRVDSEWSAVSEAFAGPGADPIRKWLGWALYRLAARVNPEIDDS